jgi:ammonium transporter, Amt family
MAMEMVLVLLGLAALTARLGLCLYLAGLSRSKNAGAAVMRSMTDLCVAVLAFWAIGNFILSARNGNILQSSLGAETFFYAAIVLIATGAALGGTLERMKLWPALVASGLLAAVVVPLAARWVWHGWLYTMGFIDVGGASVLHLTGGLAAAAGAIVVGPRQGKYNQDGSANLIPGHSVPLTAAGVLAIAGGLLAQIVGCAAIQDVAPAPAAGGAFLAAAAGGVAGLSFGWMRYATADFHFLGIGLLAGLVSASAGAGRLEAVPIVLIGLSGGLLATWASAWIDLHWHIDDPGSSISIHAVSGIWGLLAAGAFLGGLHQLAVAAIGIATIGGVSFGVAFGLFFGLKQMTDLRPSAADELDGGDLVDHDLNAYPDFQQTTIKSYHLRQM